MPDTTPQSRQRQYAKQKNLQNFSRNIFPASLPGLLNCRVITAFGQTLRNITGATNLGDVVVNQGDLAFRADRPPDNQPAGNCSVIIGWWTPKSSVSIPIGVILTKTTIASSNKTASSPSSFGPAIERVLNDPDDDPRNSLLDLDTGKVFDDPVPAPTGNLSAEMRIGFALGSMESLQRAIRERKVDLVGDASGGRLMSCDLVAVPVADEEFGSASTDTVINRPNETALNNATQDSVTLHATNTCELAFQNP